MAVQHGIWKIGEKPKAVQKAALVNEKELEELIAQDITILNEEWLLIGRQVLTDYGKYIDLLAIDREGALIIIELKKHKTSREVVAQVIDYASWVETLSSDKISSIYADFVKKYGDSSLSFDTVFKAKFGDSLVEEELNKKHQMVVVASELDASTERIISYLNDKTLVPINAVFFSVFQDGESRYLSRAWMIDPEETEEKATNSGQKGDWNGEFYCSFGAGEGGRSWDDALKYGFISAGAGHWYSKTLSMLKPGDRVWVNIPKTGYVGVATVTGKRIIADEFITSDMSLVGTYRLEQEHGEEKAEFFVPVEWLCSVKSTEQAVNEIGLFGNQNTVARPRSSKWEHTVARLKQIWAV
ncbi:endonuclease NucS domain-containing protein [Marinomonas aquiplantarum]|uniref:Uncharacterized protein DUF91 n=1 Tax=Marinomonas aquiplantarum TaxID=491951 RepID=A0A366CTF8_9GAMM|nr:endonuclease NucS domain-containing protein [Marinomonas aquiplantarum]RBO79595.1 uncharacterized protein DUF91 [Marinomonas aquiplantarum]